MRRGRRSSAYLSPSEQERFLASSQLAKQKPIRTIRHAFYHTVNIPSATPRARSDTRPLDPALFLANERATGTSLKQC